MVKRPAKLERDKLEPIVAKLVADVRRTKRAGHGFEARAALAARVIEALDDLGGKCEACGRVGAQPRDVPALTKELRALISEMADGIPRSGDISPFGSDLPAAVRNAKGPKPANDRAGNSKGRRATGTPVDAVATPRRGRRGGDRPGDQ